MRLLPIRRGLVVAAVVLGPGVPSFGQVSPPTLAPNVDPSKFRVTVFAEGLNYPTSMQQLSDGSLLVGTSRPNAGGDLFNSTGELVRLVDADGDGHADGSGTVLYSGLPGTVTSVRQAGDLVFVASLQAGQERISVLREGATPSDSFSLLGAINLNYPGGWEHKTSGMAIREVAGQPGAHELYFNIGSELNADETGSTFGLGGLISGTVAGQSIYRVTVQDAGGSVQVSDLTQIATGLRNAAGLAFRPGTGDLYFEDNGIDTPSNRNEPLSADELNRLTAAQLGGPVEDFGFSHDYIEYRTGDRVGSGAVQPIAAFQPIPDPLSGSESEGAVEIAFAPSAFPDGLNQGVFVGFHGKFNQGGLANEENPVVFYDLTTGTYFHLIANQEPDIGHPDGLLATSDSLFIADMSASGDLSGSMPNGVIYQIKAVPEPGGAVLVLVGAAVLAARRFRRAGRRGRQAVG